MTSRSQPTRQLRTVLFTDIVGSTEVAARLGDRRWRALVTRHHQAIRRELKRHRGREIDTAGDGFFATFENPTDAIRGAASAVAAVHGLGLRIRAGLHTGEVEVSGEKAGGIAVHIAARLLAMAGPEEVLVSGTLRDLVAGSGQEFEDRGVHQLKGVPGDWRVCALVLPPLDESVVVTTEEDAGEALAARRRQRMIIGALAGALVVVVVAAGVVALLPRASEPIASGPDTAVAFGVTDGRLVRGAETGRGPGAAEVVDGSLWVANTGSGTMTRVDPSTGATMTLGQVSSRPSDVTSSGDLVWVADRYSDQVTLLSGRTGELQGRLESHASAIDFGQGAVWAADDLRDQVRRLDPRTGAELDAIALPEGSGPTDVVAGGNAVWVAAARADRVLRLDPRTGVPGADAFEVSGVERLSGAGSDLWAVSPSQDAATRIDLDSSRVAVRAPVCDSPVAVAAVGGGGGAWIACSKERALWHVDHTGVEDRKIPLDAVPTDVVLEGDRVWVTLRED